MSVIKAKNLSKSYEYFHKEAGFLNTLKTFFYRKKLWAEAVKDISFSIEEGEIVGFLGPNGAGKTTTLKMLSGIIEPNDGEVEVLGYVPWKRQRAYQKQFGLVVGQKDQLVRALPAIETFIINKEIYEVPDAQFRETLDELVELLDVKDILNIQVKKLSLGQRMKCELIASLIHRPKVLFLDEPTIGLDVTAQKSIRDFIRRYNQQRAATIVLTSHYMEDIRELCQRVIIINLGRIVYDGNLDSLIQAHAPHKLLRLTFGKNGVSKKDVIKFGELESFEPYRCTIKTQRNHTKDIAASLLSSGLPINDISIEEPDIDDVIRHIFAES